MGFRLTIACVCLLLLNVTYAGPSMTIVDAPMNGVWSEWTPSADTNVLRLVEVLQRSSTGRHLVEAATTKARASGLTMTDLIRPGEGSLTDTTLIRKFHPESPENVVFETRSKVYINRHLAWREALLDLAHELTHYVHRQPFNPYVVNFSLGDFVQSTIEGEGGEAHAFISECQAMRELFTQDSGHSSNCSAIYGADGKVSTEQAIALFYHVGSYFDQMKKIVDDRGIAKNFPHLKSEKIKFISSAYGMPYPLAAVEEYRTVLSKVCENDRRRLTYMSGAQGRSPASVAQLRSNVEERCRSVTQN